MSERRPEINEKQAAELNLKVLQRIDPQTSEVLATAGLAALYSFDQANQKWAREDKEGPLFLLKRSSNPRFTLLILNKKGHGNYIENVLGGFKFEEQAPYLMYRNPSGKVLCLWFYEPRELSTFCALLMKIVQAVNDVQQDAQTPQGNVVTQSDQTFWDPDMSASVAAGVRTGRAEGLQTYNMPRTPLPSGPNEAVQVNLSKTRLEESVEDEAGSSSVQHPIELLSMLNASQLERGLASAATASPQPPSHGLLSPASFACSLPQERTAGMRGSEVSQDTPVHSMPRSHSVAQGSDVRAKLRTVMSRLLDNDDFLKIIEAELRKVDLLR